MPFPPPAYVTVHGPWLWLVTVVVRATMMPLLPMIFVLVLGAFRHAVRCGRGPVVAAVVAALPPLVGAVVVLAAWSPWVDYTESSPSGDVAPIAMLVTCLLGTLLGAVAARRLASRLGFRSRAVSGPRRPLLAFRI